MACSSIETEVRGIVTYKAHHSELIFLDPIPIGIPPQDVIVIKRPAGYSFLIRVPGGYLKKVIVSKECYEDCETGEYVIIDKLEKCICIKRKHGLHPEEWLK